MNNQQPGPKPGNQTTEFYTMLFGNAGGVLLNVVSLLLAMGAITPHTAQSINASAPLIGGVTLMVVSTMSYILTRYGLKLPWAKALAAAYTAPGEPDLNSEPAPSPAPDPAVTQPAIVATPAAATPAPSAI